ncbi:MAG: twitching motility protein PilT [Methanomassiliicoccales archaeon]
MQKVVFDTNALLMPFEFHINIDFELRRLLGDFQAYVPGCVIGELKRSSSKHASAALSLARKYPIAETKEQGDEGVIEAARRLEAFVVTNDALIRSRLRKLGMRTIFLRSGNHLAFDGDY